MVIGRPFFTGRAHAEQVMHHDWVAPGSSPCEQQTAQSILVNLHLFVVIDAVQDSENGKDGIVRFAYIGPRQHGKLQHLVLFLLLLFLPLLLLLLPV